MSEYPQGAATLLAAQSLKADVCSLISEATESGKRFVLLKYCGNDWEGYLDAVVDIANNDWTVDIRSFTAPRREVLGSILLKLDPSH